MISVDSDLYRAHPDWAIHTGDRFRTESRNQLVLDLSRKDVRDFIVESVTSVLSSANIEYLKWDFNRHLTEVSSELFPPDQQGEIHHRFVLGVYEVMERITQVIFLYLLIIVCVCVLKVLVIWIYFIWIVDWFQSKIF